MLGCGPVGRRGIESSSGGRGFLRRQGRQGRCLPPGSKRPSVESWLVFAGGAGPVRAGDCGAGRAARRRPTHNNSSTDCVRDASSQGALRRRQKLRVDTCSDGRGQCRDAVLSPGAGFFTPSQLAAAFSPAPAHPRLVCPLFSDALCVQFVFDFDDEIAPSRRSAATPVSGSFALRSAVVEARKGGLGRPASESMTSGTATVSLSVCLRAHRKRQCKHIGVSLVNANDCNTSLSGGSVLLRSRTPLRSTKFSRRNSTISTERRRV